MKVYEKIAAITADLSKIGISKDSKNAQQGYAFRGIDQVYGALSPLLAKHGLCILPRVTDRQVAERQNRNGGTLFYTTLTVEFDFVASEDGSKHTIVTIGEAMDSGDKSSNKAMSAAYKYAAFMTFCVPTEGDNDADASTHEVAPRKPDLKLDPRGDLGKNANPAEVAKYVKAFKDAMDADADEKVIALAVYDLHKQISANHELYIAVGDAIGAEHGSKYKNAVKTYVNMAKQELK